jgi:tetratricopeptide (TPR) repeat protein
VFAPARAARAWLSTAAVIAAACGPADPLDAVRALQDSRRDYAASLEPLRKLVEQSPGNPEVQFRYGVALLATRQPALALWPLRRAAESPEWSAKANLTLGSAYALTGSYDQAVEVLSREIDRDPKNVKALTLRGSSRILSKRDYKGALADAEQILEIDPDNVDARATRAVALLNLDRVDEAGAAIDELDSLQRDDALGLNGSVGYCTARAKFAEEKGDTELAEKRYGDCLAQFPTDAGLLQQAMEFYDHRQQVDRSTELLRAALAAAPESQNYRLALASRLRAQKKPEEAERVLREGTQHPAPVVAAESWAGLAHFMVEDGRFDDAAAAYQEARRLAGDDDLLLFFTADTLVMAGRTDEALELAAKISSANPAYQSLIRGRVALARGDPAEALRQLDEGIRLWPDNAFARYYAALAAERMGNFERAIEDYRYAMRIDSRATDAYLRLARLHEAAGRDELALSALAFMPGGRQREDEAALLEIRLIARLGLGANAPPQLAQQLADPARRSAAVAALAAGVRDRAGADAAVKAIRGVKDLDLDDPAHPEALAALVEHLSASGNAAVAARAVDHALAAHPDAAVFHALRGRVLALRGDGAPAQAAFERALALDPGQPIALRGLAAIESAKSPAAALPLYERLLALDPDDAESTRGLAAVLAAQGRSSEAEERLAALLLEQPYDAGAAVALAQLRVARGAVDERTRELAHRAVLFRGGDDAKRLLERVDPKKATAEPQRKPLG